MFSNCTLLFTYRELLDYVDNHLVSHCVSYHLATQLYCGFQEAPRMTSAFTLTAVNPSIIVMVKDDNCMANSWSPLYQFTCSCYWIKTTAPHNMPCGVLLLIHDIASTAVYQYLLVKEALDISLPIHIKYSKRCSLYWVWLMIRKCIDWNYDNIPVWIWMLFITASVYEYDCVH